MGPETLEGNKGSQRGGKAGWRSVALSGWSRERLHKFPKACVSRWEIHTHRGPEPVSGLLMETLRSGTGESTFLARRLRWCWYAFMFVTHWHCQVICEGDSLSSPVVKKQRSFKTLRQVCYPEGRDCIPTGLKLLTPASAAKPHPGTWDPAPPYACQWTHSRAWAFCCAGFAPGKHAPYAYYIRALILVQ